MQLLLKNITEQKKPKTNKQYMLYDSISIILWNGKTNL